MNDMTSRGPSGDSGESWIFLGATWEREKVQVRRGMVAQDGFDKLAEVDLKVPIKLSFIHHFGQEGVFLPLFYISLFFFLLVFLAF